MPQAFPDYPFAGRRFDVGGCAMHYLDEGRVEAPLVLMVHGNPTWSFYYRRLVGTLSPTHRCIVPDHIGMGLSDHPPESQYEYTLARRVDDLEALVRHLDLCQSITLVVHDWGGMIGMALASRMPERIARVVVLNTGAFTLPPGKKMPWQLTLARSPVLGAMLVRGCNAFSRGGVKECVMRPMPPDVAAAYLAPYDSWAHRLAVHRFIQDIPLRPGDRAYDLVKSVEDNLCQFAAVPMLICWGMKDFVFDVHFLNRWIEIFPHAEVHRFADAGHYVLEDKPGEIIALVQQFLLTHPPEAAAR